jgi:hypothetical protein
MSAAAFYIEKMGSGAFAAWMVTALLLALGWNYIKQIIAFVLMKLYEFFIRENAMKL